MESVFEAFISNPALYSAGHLVGETLHFPTNTEEVQSLLKRIGVDGVRCQEYFIISLLALTSYIHFRAIPAIQNNTISDYGTEITIVALGICVYIIVIGIWAAMRGFKNCKNDGTKQ